MDGVLDDMEYEAPVKRKSWNRQKTNANTVKDEDLKIVRARRIIKSCEMDFTGNWRSRL